MPVILAAGVGAATAAAELQSRAFVRYPEAELRAIKNIHEYKGKPACQACHPGRDRRLKAEPVALCSGCHSFSHKNHPVKVPVKVAGPLDVPLGEGRTVLCHTCHDPHDLKAFKYGLRMEMTPLCKRCHPGH